jgi:hypothetical protein
MIIKIELTKKEQKLAKFFEDQYKQTIKQRIINDAKSLMQKTEHMYQIMNDIERS